MILAFKLSMPGRNSWNGGWSGDGRFYAKVVNIGRIREAISKGKSICDRGSYGYRWDDGWVANITVSEVTPEEARRIRKQSKGFCGYDWMVRNILLYGETKPPEEP